MYYREPRSPSPAETQALGMATHLAGIAIARKLAREERERLLQAQANLAHINRVTTMGELTASLAHEIKQPITAAVINAKTCLRWLGRDDPNVSEAREAASRLVTDVTRAADIISRISLLFKKGVLQHELVDANELIREMIVLLRNEAARYSISIRCDLAEDLPTVMADRIQLQQVFMNLMLNGIDSMKDVGTARELTIRSQRVKDGQLLISVSDTGIGLPPQPEQIFSAFFTTKAHGTGMGLPISRSIIESHGGRLWATANSGQGASFHFSLPSEVEIRQMSAQGDTPLSA
jgi:signal transduction histidine kinase